MTRPATDAELAGAFLMYSLSSTGDELDSPRTLGMMEGMSFDFDRPIDRRHSDSTKWRTYDTDVLPLWTADMDFAVPPPVIEALHARVSHGVFGYCVHPPELRDLIAERMWSLYRWRVRPDEVVLQTGVLKAFQLAASLAAGRTDGILIQPPVYPPILGTARHNGSVHQEAPLVRRLGGQYEIDFDAFEAAITASTRVFILCNPHNPVGRVFRRGELERLAAVCLRHDVLICSDEIHCDLVYPGPGHLPIASLGPEVSHRVVTLMAPSKTFNIPGLRCSFANRVWGVAGETRDRAVAARPGTTAATRLTSVWPPRPAAAVAASRTRT